MFRAVTTQYIMTESECEGEIEYLDEDEQIVQHCVQITQSSLPQIYESSAQSLLVERPSKRKRYQQDDDSEYDPSTDGNWARSRKHTVNKIKPNLAPSQPKTKNVLERKITPKKAKEFDPVAEYLMRKKCSIRIPDYGDPLCLPVRAVRATESDIKRLNNWNNVCLEHFKHCDSLLKPERGDAKKSVRIATFKNVINKETGNKETTIWSKTSVENEDGDKKSEIFQCTLPRYKEKKCLSGYQLGNNTYKKLHVKSEVILSREEHKDPTGGPPRDALVVYKPNESLSAVYTLVDKRVSNEDTKIGSDTETKLYMKEVTCCKLCAPCFQASWRGVRGHKPKSLKCPICGRSYVTTYNLLSHFQTHGDKEVRMFRRVISAILADLVGYHYRCRICREQFDSISALVAHVSKHRGNHSFACEVCKKFIN